MRIKLFFFKMTSKQINQQLIKDVETAVNNVANAYNGAFKIKKSDEGTDRVSNFTLRLTSSEWNKDAQIKFSIDKPSEYVGDADDPTYYAACEMGMRVNFYDGFVGTKHSIDIMGRPSKEKVGKFIETLFLPTSIEILKFAKTNKKEINKKLPGAEWTKFKIRLRDFYRDMWKGTIKKVPTEEQISQLFFADKTNESILETKQITENMKSYSIDYALNNYLDDVMMEIAEFKRNTFFVLSLGSETLLHSIKDFAMKTFGKEAFAKKPGKYNYFILFKNMDKKEILDKLNKLEMFGEYWKDDEVYEFDRKGVKYYMTRIVFED